MKIKMILGGLIIFFLGCGSKKVNQDDDIKYMYMLFNQYSTLEKMNIPSFTRKNDFWKKGNNIIESVYKLIINTNDSVTKTEMKLEKYVYFDFNKKIIREYATLTDTATLQKEYPFSDSVSLHGAWDFRKEFIINYKVKENISDTVIEKVLYKRSRYLAEYGKNKFTFDAFFDCSTPRSQFELSANLGDESNCAHVKTVNYLPDGKTVNYSSEIFFSLVPDKSLMNRVFNAWSQ